MGKPAGKAEELGYGPRLKIERAKHHIRDFHIQAKAHLAKKPTKLMVRYKPKLRQKEIFSKAEIPTPPELALIVGDAVHNLAAALDLTMYAMLADKCPSPWEIKFPFAREKKTFESTLNKTQVCHARKKVIDVVRDLKPWPDKDGSPILSGLHRIDARDKHRLLIITSEFLGIDAQEFAKLGFPTGHAKPGVTIMLPHPSDRGGARFTLTGVGFGLRRDRRKLRDWEEEGKIESSAVVVFGEGQPFELNPVETTLTQIVEEVDQAVTRLIDAFLS